MCGASATTSWWGGEPCCGIPWGHGGVWASPGWWVGQCTWQPQNCYFHKVLGLRDCKMQSMHTKPTTLAGTMSEINSGRSTMYEINSGRSTVRGYHLRYYFQRKYHSKHHLLKSRVISCGATIAKHGSWPLVAMSSPP